MWPNPNSPAYYYTILLKFPTNPSKYLTEIYLTFISYLFCLGFAKQSMIGITVKSKLFEYDSYHCEIKTLWVW